MKIATGLAELEEQVASDLQRIAWPSEHWVKPRTAPDGSDALNVLIIGGGQGGLALGFQLMRERVDRVLIVDRSPPNQRGPWQTYGRMLTLRSPKFTTGPDLDIPSLTFQSWFTAQHGDTAWRALGKIPKEMWGAYLAWYEKVLDLPVQQPVEVTALEPRADLVQVRLTTPDGPQTLYARHVILATGIESTGKWWMPGFLRDLPGDRCQHAGEEIDFTRLVGKTVAVLGAGASAFDNAATALEAGAGYVHLFWRRHDLQRIQPYKHISYTGFLRHMGDLDDADRWRFMCHLLNLREAFPAETWERVTRHPNVTLHSGCDWTGAGLSGDGQVVLQTAHGPFTADHVIAGTGFDVDPAGCPLLAPMAPQIAQWADMYQPAAGEEDPRLARYPYLGKTFELLPKPAQDAPGLSRIRLFTFGATMSFGPSGSSINALKVSVPRLVSGITRDLFREDAAAHFDDMVAYDAPEFPLTMARDIGNVRTGTD
ncbi:MAG: FAD/NAD(P)-binding protein [Pseudomonadota bacterium]